MKKLFLLFIDGIGLAEKSEENLVSLLFQNETDGFGLQLINKPKQFSCSILCPLDATLGTKGEPQSATGQASIFTGVNAAQKLGYHLPAFPNEELVEVISEKSIMKNLHEKGISVTSANMYSEEFFRNRRATIKNRFPVSTLTIEASKATFRMIEEYNEGKAVFADITNELIRKRGYDMPIISPENAGKRLNSIMADFDFVFFEYFMTDLYGHKKNVPEMNKCVETLNRFTKSIVEERDLRNEAILVVRDRAKIIYLYFYFHAIVQHEKITF